MTKPKPRPKRAVDAVRTALGKEQERRPVGMKPIEIVKVAISAYQKHQFQREGDNTEHETAMRSTTAAGAVRPTISSDDRAGLQRGTQASVDRLLFNANYWRDAYEDRIVAACSNPDDARACLKAASVWTSHALKLNVLSQAEVTATFERFCPPFSINNRRGSEAGAVAGAGAGKGPVADFKRVALSIAGRETPERASALDSIVHDMEAEALVYEELSATSRPSHPILPTRP